MNPKPSKLGLYYSHAILNDMFYPELNMIKYNLELFNQKHNNYEISLIIKGIQNTIDKGYRLTKEKTKKLTLEESLKNIQEFIKENS
jgi:hypothetical protein